MTEQVQSPDPKTRWKNMRRMAWLALVHALGCSVYIQSSDTLLIILGFDATIIGAYMGFSTWRDGWGNK